MWGDPGRAASLEGNDPLATLLFQIASPAHIPWGDARWQEVLHGYDVWVHISTNSFEENTLISNACQSLAKHAGVSSNLAALCLHVTRMLRVLVKDVEEQNNHDEATSNNNDGDNGAADFSRRVSRVGKARATAGALQLLRILCHPIIANEASRDDDTDSDTDATNVSSLEEAFLYRTRGDLPCDQPSALPLLHSLLDLISAAGGENNDAIQTPEVYDAVVLSFHLLFVLLGSQLYHPFRSSFENKKNSNGGGVSFCFQELFRETKEGDINDNDDSIQKTANNLRTFFSSSRSSLSTSSLSSSSSSLYKWTPRSILETCMEWQIRRPPAPERSLAHSYYHLAKSAVSSGQTVVGPDGMYESHLVVQAEAPTAKHFDSGGGGDEHESSSHQIKSSSPQHLQTQSHNIILDATRGVLVLSSSIIFLPFRLMTLVLGVLTSKGREKATPTGQRYQPPTGTKSRTKDVLWLSDSCLADLGSCLVLLLINNARNGYNPFRHQFQVLQDNRWQRSGEEPALPDLPALDASTGTKKSQSSHQIGEEDILDQSLKLSMTLNFESLFEIFGRTLHTEVGALMLYTLIQSSPNFAESLVVRSDLDTLVLPLLRTLYFSSKSNSYTGFVSSEPKSKSSGKALDLRSCPFRSLSQLYVIIILLLLFSQDNSFGRDAFRRITVSNVVWYKERNLRNINLGSVILLTLLRSLLSDLYRIHDAFLLNNCCAVLMNLAPSIVDLHEYAAMRLASVTVTVLKRHSKLLEATPNINEDEEFLSSPLGMYGEVARTLLGTINHCLSSRNIDRNLHLVYALVYHQFDLLKLLKKGDKEKSKQFSRRETERICLITHEAATLIQKEGARTAIKALNVLEVNIDVLHKNIKRKKEGTKEDFTFTYEEEADPEVFFVPYVWETIVCVVTSSSIEWVKDSIRVFPLLEILSEVENHATNGKEQVFTTPSKEEYNEDGDDLV